MVFSEEELLEEKKKMYEAIGYSENAEAAIYPKEVYTCTCAVLCTSHFHLMTCYT